MKVIVELHRNKNSNPTRSDLKYPTDFGFRKKCRIPSDSDSESVTSLVLTGQMSFLLPNRQY